jgi:hypothetical protein
MDGAVSTRSWSCEVIVSACRAPGQDRVIDNFQQLCGLGQVHPRGVASHRASSMFDVPQALDALTLASLLEGSPVRQISLKAQKTALCVSKRFESNPHSPCSEMLPRQRFHTASGCGHMS